MDYLNKKYFSEEQSWIIDQKLENKSYDDICHNYKFSDKLSKDAIKTCLKRSSLSLRWDKGTTVGRIPTLSEVDIDALKTYIIDNAIDGELIDVKETIEEAERLRKERIKKARNFLIFICDKIAEAILLFSHSQDIERDWVYHHINEMEAELNRIIACTPSKIQSYSDIIKPFLLDMPTCLIFGADETTLQPKCNNKILVPNQNQTPIVPNDIELPHITAMCCSNVSGDKLLLFNIFPALKKLPKESQSFSNSKGFFSSSPSGWQTRDTFLWFSIIFINWLSQYRLKLTKDLKDHRALLIMDGHISRENPLAIKILKDHNIDVFVLPAHTSHVLANMKSYFSEEFKKLFRFFRPELNQDGQLRYFCVLASIYSWEVKAHIKSCSEAARLTGIYLYSPQILLQNSFFSGNNATESKDSRRKS